MVINIGWLKNKQYDDVRADIAAVKAAVGDKVLKVIIETCLLTDEEKEKMCDIVVEAGADFIKTSTGFSTAGATFHDGSSRIFFVSGRKSGSSPASRRFARSTRASRSSRRRDSKARCSVATRASASGVRISAISGETSAVIWTPSGRVSVLMTRVAPFLDASTAEG